MSLASMAMQAYLHILAFALQALGAISLIGYLQLEQPSRHTLILLPDSAVAAILLGLCLLANTKGWRRFNLACTGAVVLLCGSSLALNLSTADLPESRAALGTLAPMRSALALGSILLAVAMQLRRHRRLGKGLCQALGVLMLSVGLPAQLAGDWLPLAAMQLAFKPENTVIACLFTLSLGAALLILPRQPEHAEPLFDSPSLVAGALGSLLTALIWYVLSAQNAESLVRQSSLALAQAQLAIERTLAGRLALLRQIAESWQALDQPSEEAWDEQSDKALGASGDLQLLGLLDPRLQPYRINARRPEADKWLEAFLANPGQREWLQQVQRSGRATNSATFLHQGDNAATLLAVPLQAPGSAAGLLIAELDVGAMVAASLNTQPPGLLLRVFEGRRLVFGPGLDPALPAPTPIGELQLRLPNGDQWRLSSQRDDAGPFVAMSYLPSLVLLFGQTFGFLLMLSLRLTRLARERSDHLHRLNDELASSLQRQTQLQALNQHIMTCSLDVLCSIDARGFFSQVSPSSHTVFGYLPEEMIARPYLQFVHPDERQQAAAELQAIVAGDASPSLRHRCRRKDGSDVYVLWSVAWSASDHSLFAVAHDVTPLVQNEAYLEDQRDILSMISTDQPLEQILDCICQLAEAREPAALCSVMLVDRPGRNLYLAAGPRLPHDYRRHLSSIPIAANAGSCGTAMHRRRMVVVSDIASDPLWQDYRAPALAHGLHACWSIPLISHRDEALGSLAIYHRQVMEPDDDQLQLIATVGQLAAIAIAHQKDRLRLQESRQRYRSLFSLSPDPVFSLGLDGKLQSVNRAGYQLFGYSEQELLGEDFSRLAATDQQPRLDAHFQAACQGQAQHFETRCHDRQGNELQLEVTGLPIMVDEQIVGVFLVAKNIAERNRMTHALRATLQHSEHQAELLRGLNESAVTMSALLDNQSLLDFMAERLRTLIGAHQALVSLVQDGRGSQSLWALSLSDKYQAWRATVFEEDAFTPLLDQLDQPLLLSDAQLRSHPQWSHLDHAGAPLPPRRGWLAVPLKDQAGNKLGLLQLSDKAQGEFDPDDLAVAQQFAQMAVAVLEHSRLLHAVMAAEKRLKSQLSFTSAIANSTAEGLLAIDNQGLLSFINPAAARLIGRSTEQLLGQPLAEYLPLPLGDWPLPGAEPDNLSGEFCLPKNAHGRLYMAFDSAPLLDGSVHDGWVVAVRDISAQRLADQAMRERDRFFSLSLEMLCMISLEGDFLQVNPTFQDELGYPQACLIGHPYLALIEPQDRPLLAERMQRLLAGEPLLDLEFRALDIQGQPHWLQMSAAMGEEQVIYCAARNINARKQAEQALQESLRELERSNRELQEFAFVASHDLQEPLRKIQAFSECLLSRADGLDPQGQDYLGRMKSAAARMQSLIRDLLAYSRVTSRGRPFQRLSLEGILDEVLQDLEVSLENSGALVEREALPTLDGDPTQLRQLLQNLLSNAIKFRREGEPPRIRVYAERQGLTSWTLCVADQGIGFDEKYLDRIFNPFQRLHGPQAYPGTGIGLAIVKKIAERHGARVNASSCPGQGSTFRIVFMGSV
ncbi:PAS domain S-box protein [Pseudomonas zhanjiangensis]|uniref:histidine kinase n=1 Tax=Pseudomonas zhanjiangensis TaxID=3239015 RepID=A0ABV3YVB8_9PSED